MATINGVYQEVCTEGNVACINRNIKRLLNALDGNIKSKIDDQSEGIAFGQKQLEQNIITSTRNKIDETERIMKDNINAVYSKAADTNEKINDLENYVTTTQKQQLDDIETSLGQVSLEVSRNTGDIVQGLNDISEGMGQAQDNIIHKINTELDVSSKMLQGEINEHDRAVIERFENVAGLISNSANALNRAVEDVSAKTTKEIKYAAVGINESTNNIVKGATSQIESKIVEVEEKRDKDNWGLFEGVRKWIEELFTIDPDAIAKTLMTITDVGAQVAGMTKNKEQG